jgi:hypothetical protein
MRALDHDVPATRAQGDAHRARELIHAAAQGFAGGIVELDPFAHGATLPEIAREGNAVASSAPDSGVTRPGGVATILTGRPA